MASFYKCLSILFTLFFTLVSFSHAYIFNIGGKNGWTLHPTENYNQWSARMRFIVNDTLHFKYNGGSDSVLVVNKGDYDNCNISNPITTLTGGDSSFSLNRSGPFYFISGNKTNCDQGQKVTVVVLSPKKMLPPPGAPAPASSSPAVSPVSSPPESGISASPATSAGGAVSSPSNPADVNAPAPKGSPATRPAVSATLTMVLAMIIFVLGLVC
ncbi:early nodulin-like protein 2 [Rutidosis leptorrhynchoides]|uniref:early nodulin-like protein 2 n=1 Tax=Rutidosis leptorrhynchoides TaxID=125765 RepID=UPI003A98E200